ncbi:thiol-disulfide oxidoreductase DCC family protein [Thalassotalea montiporae]
MAELTLFFDGNCPLCIAEINALAKRNTKQLIQFEDLHQSDFATQFPDIDSQEAMRVIYGKLRGKVITGIDVNYHAWRLVGKEFWVKPLAWRLTRPLAKLGYRLFAANRHSISKFYAKLTKQETLDKQDCGCTVSTTVQQSCQSSNVSDGLPHTEHDIDSKRKMRQ